jgi:hypothetical protein
VFDRNLRALPLLNFILTDSKALHPDRILFLRSHALARLLSRYQSSNTKSCARREHKRDKPGDTWSENKIDLQK